MPVAKYRARAGTISSIRAASAAISASTTRRSSRPRSPTCGGGKDSVWLVTTNRGDNIRARVHRARRRPAASPKLPGLPGIASFKGHQFPHEPLGLCLYRRRFDGRLTGGRTRSSASSALARRPCNACRISAARAALRLPAHAVIRRFPQRPADRSRTGRDRSARLAETDGQFLTVVSGRTVRRGHGQRRLDRPDRQHPAPARRAMLRGETVEDPMKLMQVADYQKMERVRAHRFRRQGQRRPRRR